MRRIVLTTFTLLVSSTVVAAQPVTEAEAAVFAKEFASAINARNLEAIGALLDADEFIRRGVPKFDNGPQRAAVEEAMLKTASLPRSARSVLNQFREDGSLTFLRLLTHANEPALLFRVEDDSSYVYHTVILRRVGNGELHVVDVHLGTSSQTIREGFREVMEAAFMVDAGQRFDVTKPSPRVEAQNAALAKFLTACQGDDIEAIDASYDALSDAFKATRTVAVQRLNALADTDRFGPLVIEFAKRFGPNVSSDLMLCDVYVASEKYGDARACIDRVDSHVKDPYLDVARGHIEFSAGKFDAAAALYRQCLQRGVEHYDAYMGLVDVALEKRDFADLKQTMLAMENKFDVRFDDEVLADDVYAAFRASPQYQEFLKDRPKD